MKPNFSEAVNWINTQDEVEEFAKLMDNFISSIKQKYNQVHVEGTSHTYVSSNLPIENLGNITGVMDGNKTKEPKNSIHNITRISEIFRPKNYNKQARW